MNVFTMIVTRLGLAAIPGVGVVTTIGQAVTAVASFLSSPVGKWVGLALIGAGLYIIGDIHRGRLDAARYEAKWQAAVRQAEAARTTRDEAIQREVSVVADKRIAAIQRESELFQTKVTEYEQALSTSNAVACRVSPDDARRLRGLGYGIAANAGRGASGVRSYPAGGRTAGGQSR
jgi:hypothetical protein